MMASILLVFLVYELFRDKWISMLSGFAFSVLPWVFVVSRSNMGGFTPALAGYIWGMLFLVKPLGTRSSKFAVLSAAGFAFSMYSHIGGRLACFLFFVSLFIWLSISILEPLGLWIADTEGVKFWLNVITEIKKRGVNDILIACIDGLKGFPEAIAAVFPKTEIQLCIVHMIRNSLKYVPYKDYKEIFADLKGVYKAKTEDEAKLNLEKFASKWDDKYPAISQLWRKHWELVCPFFAYPDEIRKVIYTTNAIESVNSSVRKIIRSRGAFPNNEAIVKSCTWH